MLNLKNPIKLIDLAKTIGTELRFKEIKMKTGIINHFDNICLNKMGEI